MSVDIEHLKKTLLSRMLSKFRKYLEEWRLRTPIQKWQTVYNIGAFLAESVGVTVYGDMKNYWFSYFSEVIGSIYFILASYTVWFYFRRQEYLRGLQATCAIGVVVACLIVHIQTLSPVKYKFHNLVNFSGRYVYIEHDQRPKMCEVREKMIGKLIKNCSIVVIMIAVAIAMLGLPSVYLILFKGVRISFLGTEVPFFDKDSDIGFFLNIFFQLVIAVLGSIGCFTIEIAVVLTFNGISAFPLLIRVDLEELDAALNLKGIRQRTEARLRNVFMKIQDYERLVRDLIETYYLRLFVGPFLFTYSISFSIFGQLLLGYPSGYGIAFANYLFLLICCHMGEEVELAKSGIEVELYNMQWYLLPTESQKQLFNAMQMIHNGGVLTIGPFSKLNMESSTDLTIKIYRVTMLLYRVFI